ncbi:PEP/pyruvate-binding domain-containing protein [Streptomyces sp. 900105755]
MTWPSVTASTVAVLDRAAVVRSSSLHEDSETSSTAGRFDSALDVWGWEAFVSAVQAVLDSARRIRPLRPSVGDLCADGMAVLVQPTAPRRNGVSQSVVRLRGAASLTRPVMSTGGTSRARAVLRCRPCPVGSLPGNGVPAPAVPGAPHPLDEPLTLQPLYDSSGTTERHLAGMGEFAHA